jgi:hypothetical protein
VRFYLDPWKNVKSRTSGEGYRENLQDFLSKWPLKSLGPIGPRAVRDRVKNKIGLK